MIRIILWYGIITDVVIGFINAPYAANENDGNAVFEIGIISGRLQREVSVEFSIFSGSAVGK